MKYRTIILTLLLASGCRSGIDWANNREPPLITMANIQSLPETITVRDFIKRFGAGMPDPEAWMFMKYRNKAGGWYFVTWRPTPELPTEKPVDLRTVNDVLQQRVVAILDAGTKQYPELPWTYVYPQRLNGTTFAGW